MRARKREELGRYVIADLDICGGQATFKSTRIFVNDVLTMLTKGYDWDRITAAFDGRPSHAAIAEATAMASNALNEEPHRKQRGIRSNRSNNRSKLRGINPTEIEKVNEKDC